jgi:regulator of protease activity HflC (stomatin/prohibitin superfamily)
MKKIKVLGVTLLILVLVAVGIVTCTERIPTGYVGVVYNMNGGVQGETLTQGFHIVSPTKHVKQFSVGNEQLVLSKDKREGSPDDDSFLVSTSDNANIRISFQMSYRYDESTVIDTYKKFKGMDGEQIVNSRVKTIVKSRVSEVTSKYTMMDIYSGNRGKINADITSFLAKDLHDEFGIEVIDATIIDVHPDKQLEKAIKERVTAMQKKQQAEAEQATAKVEAETAVITAKGQADAAIEKARGEAESNRLIAESITQPLIDMKNADARLKHGWVTIQGGTPIVDATNGQ